MSKCECGHVPEPVLQRIPMTDDLRTRVAQAIFKRFECPHGDLADISDEWESWWLQGSDEDRKPFYDQADAVIRELNTNCIGYQIWNAAEWISVNSGWVPYEINRNADGSGGGWRVTVQRIEADDE